MSRVGGTMRTTRPKKLTPKQPIPIFRENQINLVEDDNLLALQSVETGVEKAEESEFHLQAAINAARLGRISEAHIPTPETVVSSINYDDLYKPCFSQPTTYIRFSSTVEDCSGCNYDMTEEDEVALRKINAGKPASQQCSEDTFEELMAFFEDTAQLSQPFAAVDHPPVVSYAEMEQSFDQLVDEKSRIFAPDVYEHWKSVRTAVGNRPLRSNLKFETGQETDDADPYVCFRRREVRQVRKTRGRDAQSAEKLRRLRKELEDARELLRRVCERENMRKDQLVLEKKVFQQRCEFKEMKRKLSIKEDDDELITYKVPKKKPQEVSTTVAKPAPGAPARLQTKTPLVTEELQSLESITAEKEMEILADIRQNMAKHARWNEGYVDWTTTPLTPTPEQELTTSFRPAITTEYLPTPPSSLASDEIRRDVTPEERDALVKAHDKGGLTRQTTPPSEETPSTMTTRDMPSFRRRVGRGGRILIDRRNISCRPRERSQVDPIKLERFKYDQDDDLEEPVYEHDPYDVGVMQHRTYLTTRSRDQAAASQAQLQSQINANPQAQAQLMQAQLAQAQAQGHLSSPIQNKLLQQRRIWNERFGRLMPLKTSP